MGDHEAHRHGNGACLNARGMGKGGISVSVAVYTAKWHGATIGQELLKVAGLFHRILYRASGGQIGRTLAGAPVLLLTTTGRKTGQSRTRPLCYLDIEGRLILIASAGGASCHPAWYLNLRQSPRVSVQRGQMTRAMVARSAVGDERARLWEYVVERYPMCAEYQRKARREIPIVVLQPEYMEGR
jgi:F420H(2)-dependent quinone reductase